MKKKSEGTKNRLALLEANTIKNYTTEGFSEHTIRLLQAVEDMREKYNFQLYEESGNDIPYELFKDYPRYSANNDIDIMKEKLHCLRKKILLYEENTIDWLLLKYKINGMQYKLNQRLKMENTTPLLKFGNIVFTHHALVRFLERRYNIDIDKIKEHIKNMLAFMEDEIGEITDIPDLLILEYFEKHKGVSINKIKNNIKLELDAQFFYMPNYLGELRGSKFTYVFKENKLLTLYPNNQNDKINTNEI